MTKSVHRGWAYSAVILALIAASLAWDRHKTSRALDDIFHYSYRVTLIDMDSGMVLPAGMKSPPTSSTDIVRQTQTTAAHPDGSMTIYGVGYTPRTFTFAAPGYGSESITIGPESPSMDHITIKLAKIPKEG